MTHLMEKCQLCKEEKLIAKSLGVCQDCLLNNRQRAKRRVFVVHKKARARFGLPYPAPKDPKGVKCNLCVNQCQVGEGNLSFCGLKTCKNGKLISLGGTAQKGILEHYFDPLPTNCVASWVCEGNKVLGMKNLAVFYGSCSLNCLFCQNWHFRQLTKRLSPVVSAKELAEKIDDKTFCICFFGGDLTPQLPHALATAREISKKQKIRICFETNGSMNEGLARKIAKVALKSKGIVKFDLKAYSEHLHLALTGVSNKYTLKNFEILASEFLPKTTQPFLVASTLLVPGYIDQEEISKIAKFIAKLDRAIPYSLLAFYPHFYMRDLPPTSKKQALACQEAALSTGLTNVRIGNVHLLS